MRGNREIIHLPVGHSFRVYRWSHNLREVWTVVGPNEAERIPGQGRRWHYHTEMEITLFTAGTGTRFVGDHIGPFTAGDLVLLGGNLPHYWQVKGPSAGVGVQWSFPHGHPFWTLPETLGLAELFKRSAQGLRFTGHTAAVLAPAVRELTYVYGAERLGLFVRLLAMMRAAPENHCSVLSSAAFSLSGSTNKQREALAEAMRFVLANFREAIRLEEVLRLTGLSRTTFSLQFKKHCGRSFIDFVIHTRLQEATRQLAETDRSILEIALDCGFTQVSFFNRVFRRVYGCNPTEFRADGARGTAAQAR